MSFPSQNTSKSMSAGTSPQTPLEAYSAPPDSLAGFKGAISRQEGNGWEGREVLEGRGKGEGRGMGNGEGMGKGGSWGIAPWLLGVDTRVCYTLGWAPTFRQRHNASITLVLVQIAVYRYNCGYTVKDVRL